MLKRRFFLSILFLLLVVGCSTDPGEHAAQQEGVPGSAQTVRLFEPVRPIDDLRVEALAADPPVEEGHFKEPGLVELKPLDPSIKLDIRYATDDNFMGAAVYESARAFLQRPVAEDLLEVNRELHLKGLGLIVFDGYRPWYVTRIFWDATPDDKKAFVADPEKGSRHNRGAAVDVSLYRRSTGEPLVMPSGFDETTERAAVDYSGGNPEALANRDLLISTMRRHGFEPLANEWWHFDHASWRDYPILNLRFDEIE